MGSLKEYIGYSGGGSGFGSNDCRGCGDGYDKSLNFGNGSGSSKSSGKGSGFAYGYGYDDGSGFGFGEVLEE